MLKFYTAGESHGQALFAYVSGLPAQLPIDLKFINNELHRRQLGYGRGGRQKIEKDTAEIFAGVRHGKTIGAPIALRIENRDWVNWEKMLPVEAAEEDQGMRKLVAPRPGHADLAGSQKFNYHDARYVLERASARETAARVAAGAFAKLLLREFGTEIASHTIQVGHVRLEKPVSWKKIHAVSADLDSPLRCIDAEVQEKMKAEVDAVLKAGDTVGGIFEIVAHNVPVGLGSHAQWDEKLDGRLAQAVMSVQAVKAVEIGNGVRVAGSFGSGRIGAWCQQVRWPGKPWSHLCWRMLFCKNLEETRWRRCGGTLTTMPDKLTSSEPASAAATETPQATSAAGKIYPIVKY